MLLALGSLGGVGYFRFSQREAQFHAMQSAAATILTLQAKAIDDGFFSWTALRTKVASGDVAGAEALAAEITETYPFVRSVEIHRGRPPARGYSIDGDGRSFVLSFGIKDDDGEDLIGDMKAEASVDAQTLFDSLRSQSRLIVDPGRGSAFVYSVKARFEKPLLGPIDYFLVALLTAAFLFPLSSYLQRRDLYFYESKGLESIIFLFEQTEKVSANHSRKVAALAVFLGEKLGYGQARLRNLYTAALLHDIGKISIPTSILLKEGPLSRSEQAVVQTHPILSARILKNFKELSHLSEAVLYHHERMDGSGYPEGRKGEEIPEEARLIAVVDVFEALVGDRPYREPLSSGEAMAILRTMPLDKRLVSVLEAECRGFPGYRPPKWVVAYDRTLKKA